MRHIKIKTIIINTISLVLIPAVIVGFVPTTPNQDAIAYTQADADALQTKINELRAKEDDLTKKAAEIAAETAGFAREKAQLENEIAVMENNIKLLEAEIEQLENEIEINKNKIDNTQLAISQTLVDMYISQDVTTLERLASSQSFASFIDDNTKQTAATDSLATAVESIKVIKAELERQHNEVKAKQDNIKSQKETAEANRTALQRAINGNNIEQAAFVAEKENTVEQRKAAMAEHSRILWELNKDSIGGSISTNKGGFPDQNICPGYQGRSPDRWGMYYCECVSYAAWKVQQYYGIKVRNVGGTGTGRGCSGGWCSYNARYWVDRFSGIVPMGKTPRERSVAVWEKGYAGDNGIGHVAWVEYIDSNGNVWVSEYNVKPGDYSERNASKSSYYLNAAQATYIYFDEY